MDRAPLLLYLHGFLSSPQSVKAQQTLDFIQQYAAIEDILIPALEAGPAQAVDQVDRLVAANLDRNLIFMGSSLGGYYATYLADKHDAPAALINPAVRPFEYWEDYLGDHANYYSGEVHTVTRDHIEELRDIDVPALKCPDNFRAYLQTGDATLDYRRAVTKYGAAHCVVHEGGNHSFENFAAELPNMLEFLLSRIGAYER